jgi:hypothetical protein
MELFEKNIVDFLQDNKVHIMILTPCYGSSCYTNYVSCLMNTVTVLNKYRIDHTINFCNNDSLVPRARTNMLARAMNNPETTHVMYIDADILWDPIEILKLLLANKPINGGIYPIKHYNWERLSEPDILQQWKTKQESPYAKDVPDHIIFQNCLLRYNYNAIQTTLEIKNNITEVRHLATGFMMVRRDVVECMQKAFPSTKYQDDVGYLTDEEKKHAYALFDCAVEEGHYLSEDWLFCERWKNMGGKIYADLSINLTHIGIQNYKGSFLRSII